jgi:3-oxoacyl-[acyl-carrier protein] reductase
MSLEGRVALVTGATRGIGRATAMELARQGAMLAVASRSADGKAREVVEEIERMGGKAVPFSVDLSHADGPETLLAAVATEFGRLDVLVNNAGIAIPEPLEAISRRTLDVQISVNLAAPLLLTKAAQPLLSKNGGSIVNVSSINAAGPVKELSVYSATKAGLEAITVALAAELGRWRIRVNAVAPGPTDTDMFRGAASAEMRAAIEAATPLGRIANPHDVAAAICFLASDAARWISGAVIPVSGGLRS